MVYGDRDLSVEAEVGFLMLAKVFQCFVVDHQPSKQGG
jgi:hypothetical protein